MVLIVIPEEANRLGVSSIIIGVALSLIIAGSAFMYALIFKDFIFELLKRWGIYDIDQEPQTASLTRLVLVHIAIMIVMVVVVSAAVLFLMYIYKN